MREITAILSAVQHRQPRAADELLPVVYEKLCRLAQADPRAAEVVKLCFFVGLTHEQAATHLDVSVSTVERTWAFARAWLFREMKKERSV